MAFKGPDFQNIENSHLLVLLTALCLVLSTFTQPGPVQVQLLRLSDMFAAGALAILVPKYFKNGNGNGNGNGSGPSGPTGPEVKQ